MAEIGIVIVTYNSEARNRRLPGRRPARRGADVVVVDNGSHDGTIAEVARRGVRLIANPSNRGFAAAVNQGFAVLDSPYVLLLNPDAVLRSGLERAAGGLRPSRRRRRRRPAGGRRRTSADRFHGAPTAHSGRLDFGSSLA